MHTLIKRQVDERIFPLAEMMKYICAIFCVRVRFISHFIGYLEVGGQFASIAVLRWGSDGGEDNCLGQHGPHDPLDLSGKE